MNSNIDLSYLRQMTRDDQDTIQQIINEILQQMEEFPNIIQNLLDKKEFKEISVQAHKLKSSMQIIGAEELHKNLVALERVSKEHNFQETDSLFDLIKRLVSACKVELKS